MQRLRNDVHYLWTPNKSLNSCEKWTKKKKRLFGSLLLKTSFNNTYSQEHYQY